VNTCSFLNPSIQEVVMLKLYGIKNCSTMKNASNWLANHGLDFELHDYKKQGLGAARLQTWVTELGWEALVNRRGTTWRTLPEAEREGINAASAIELMLANPSLIKRPVLDLGTRRLVGFSPDTYAAALKKC
jgi:Spx/MgsR family transcriptional regulator